GYPFKIIDKLLYNITKDGKKLYILKDIIRIILKVIYNNKYYFNRNRILYNLKDYTIVRKT
ncbi:hypothetical protein GE21DRAFT_1222889, partial [Neurospora crassa]